MKILFVADTLAGGGKERRLVELIKGLDNLGNHCQYLLVLDSEIHYKDVFETQCTVENLNRNGGFELSILFKIRKTIKNFKPDIIHFWGDVGMAYLLPNLVFGKIPMVNSIIANTSPKKSFSKSLVRNLGFKNATLILSNTELGLRNYNAPLVKSKVIYNGFDFKRLANLSDENEIRNKYELKGDNVVMMVGAYSKRKDYKTFLSATEILLKKGNDLTVITAGNGDYGDLKEYVNPENLANYRFLNFQDDIESIMNLAKIGVLCSNSDLHGEGISNALLEFMALGKPVIATNDGGNIELIENGNSGYLVETKNSDELAEKIRLLLYDNELADNFGKRSKNIVETKFSIDAMMSEFVKSYNALYNKPSK